MDSQSDINRVWAGYYAKYSPLAAVVIQKFWRGFYTRRRIQSLYHGTLLKTAREALLRETATVVIQRHWRGSIGRAEAKERWLAIVCIQKFYRRYLVRRGWKRRLRQWRWENENAVLIQAHVRGYLARKRLKETFLDNGEDVDSASGQTLEVGIGLCEDQESLGAEHHQRVSDREAQTISKDEEAIPSTLNDGLDEQGVGSPTEQVKPKEPKEGAEEDLVQVSPSRSCSQGSHSSGGTFLISSKVIAIDEFPMPKSAQGQLAQGQLAQGQLAQGQLALQRPSLLSQPLSQRQLRPVKASPIQRSSSLSLSTPTLQNQRSPIPPPASIAVAPKNNTPRPHPSTSRVKTTSISETIAAARNEAGLPTKASLNTRSYHSSFKK